MILQTLGIMVSSFVGTIGFALVLHAPKKAWLPASAIGGVAYALYWALMQGGVSEAAAIFCGALLGSLLGQWCARRMRMIATIFVTLSIVSLVPGLGLYRFMALLGQKENALGLQAGVAAMTGIGMIALGVGLGSFLFRVIAGGRRKIHPPPAQGPDVKKA